MKVYRAHHLSPEFLRSDSPLVILASRYGVLFFALATIGFGVLNFVYSDFTMGRAPAWPPSAPGKILWAYSSGSILIVLAAAILLQRASVMAAFFIAVLVLVWALARHIIEGHWHWGTEITQAGKALTLFGGALCTAGILREKVSGSSPLTIRLIFTGRLCLGFFLTVCGIEHFMFAEFVKMLVPAWIPGNVFWTYLTGVALIAGGIGVIIEKTMRVAAMLSGIMVLIWFFILHIPRAMMSAGDGNEWIAVFESLAVSGIAFMIAGRSGG